MIDFACDYGAGDPLRWSPVSVEVFLADWFPRKVIADQEYRDRVPEAMMLFIRYCHERRESTGSSHQGDPRCGVALAQPRHQAGRRIRPRRPVRGGHARYDRRSCR